MLPNAGVRRALLGCALAGVVLSVYALYLGFQLAGSSRALIDPPYGQRFGVPAAGSLVFAVAGLLTSRWRRVMFSCAVIAVVLLLVALFFLIRGR